MTGLDLETFLRLLRADLGAWASLGAIVLIVALMAWTSWGSKRVLRKCLVVSVLIHLGMIAYGRRLPVVLFHTGPLPSTDRLEERITQIRVAPEPQGGEGEATASPDGRGRRRLADWDRPGTPLAMLKPDLRPTRSEAPRPAQPQRVEPQDPTPVETTLPEVQPQTVDQAEDRPEPAVAKVPPVALPEVAPLDQGDQATKVPEPVEAETTERILTIPNRTLRPTQPTHPAGSNVVGPSRKPSAAPLANVVPSTPLPTTPQPLEDRPESDDGPPAPTPLTAEMIAASTDPSPLVAGSPEPTSVAAAPTLAMPDRAVGLRAPTPGRERNPLAMTPGRSGGRPGLLPLDRATPAGAPRLPDITGAHGSRPLPDVPEVYRSRLDPNRSAHAQRAGASVESEQAVERALDWLARHQDSDGRWNGGVARTDDGKPLRGEFDFTAHCPPGELCSGPCYYWEADTAMTGLSLLAYLGAGYTHTDGKYAANVENGLRFLMLQQKPDGDLRGRSDAVGMYCHAMAGLALCEAFALTGDERLRGPVTRAVSFVVHGQAADGQSWRYAPGEPYGDTSILGWVILLLKSAKVVGISVPNETRNGAIKYLTRIREGRSGGLATYLPGDRIRTTMTAEAWVCRQFLGVGGPGPASDEAASFLLSHGPDRDPLNLYYWYYGTLAMYQHGGPTWTRWNAQVRDQLVRNQETTGHSAGSWNPALCKDKYDSRGGRIYCTALATLTLEVYYRYLRLYDEPGGKVPAIAPARDRSDDPSLRRAGRTSPTVSPTRRAP